MVFCNNCGKSVTATEDVGRIWCDLCGKVLVYDIYSTEPTFFKNDAGQSKVAGSFVRGFQSEVSASRERLMEKARYELTYLRNGLEMGENEEIIDIALRFYIRLSSKINFSVLENMFKTSETADVSKKPRTDSPSDNDDEMPYMENQELENTDGFGPEYNEETEGTDCENYQYNNGDEAYGDEEYDYRGHAGYDDYYLCVGW